MLRKRAIQAMLLVGFAVIGLYVLTGAKTRNSAETFSKPSSVQPKSDPTNLQGRNRINSTLQNNTFKITLQRGRDYSHVGGDVDCPNCKDLYCAALPLNGGTTFVSVQYLGGRPTKNNHWYRCQVQADCGRPEFSYPADPRFECDGKNACNICRATDDGVSIYEDDLQITTK
jgi:hypothetical protein